MAQATTNWKCCGLTMWQQVLLGLIGGIIAGFLLEESAAGLAILGTIFIKLIKMVVAPLIFFALIAGITSLTEAHHFKGMALKGTAAYLVTALLAVCMGLGLGALFQPGLNVPPPPGDPSAAAAAPPPHLVDFLMGLIPGNIVHAMADDMYLQIVVFAIFTGIVMNNIRGKTDLVKELNQQLAHIIF